jgi:hypothetical protein
MYVDADLASKPIPNRSTHASRESRLIRGVFPAANFLGVFMSKAFVAHWLKAEVIGGVHSDASPLRS